MGRYCAMSPVGRQATIKRPSGTNKRAKTIPSVFDRRFQVEAGPAPKVGWIGHHLSSSTDPSGCRTRRPQAHAVIPEVDSSVDISSMSYVPGGWRRTISRACSTLSACAISLPWWVTRSMVDRLVCGVEAGPDLQDRLDWRSSGTRKREGLSPVENARGATQPDTTRLVIAAGQIPSSWLVGSFSSGIGKAAPMASQAWGETVGSPVVALDGSRRVGLGGKAAPRSRGVAWTARRMTLDGRQEARAGRMPAKPAAAGGRQPSRANR